MQVTVDLSTVSNFFLFVIAITASTAVYSAVYYNAIVSTRSLASSVLTITSFGKWGYQSWTENIAGKLLSNRFHLTLSFKDPNSKYDPSNNMKKLFKKRTLQWNIQSYCQQDLKHSPKRREFLNYCYYLPERSWSFATVILCQREEIFYIL